MPFSIKSVQPYTAFECDIVHTTSYTDKGTTVDCYRIIVTTIS